MKVGWGCCKELGCPSPPVPGCSLVPPVPSPGISEDSKVEAPAFTDAVRMYRQSKEQYGTWDMLCGNETQVRTRPSQAGVGGVWAEQGPQSLLPSQVLSNLVMEELLPELRTTIGPRLKGKAQERQRTWIQVWGWGCRGGGCGVCVIILCHPPACTASALGATATSIPCRARCPPAFLPVRASTPTPPASPPLPAPAKEAVLILRCGFLKLLVVPLQAALPISACAASSLGRGKQTGGSPALEQSPSWLYLARHF